MDYVENRMAQEAANPTPSPEVQSIATPLNLILISMFFYIAYITFRPRATTQLDPAPPATVFRTFTPLTLLPFNGTKKQPIYFGVRSKSHVEGAVDEVKVFDVSSGKNFYGPGGPYANFAGRDASRGLACGSFDEDMLTEDLQGPLDNLDDLGPAEMEALQGWEERFSEKYLIVGRLVAVGEDGA